MKPHQKFFKRVSISLQRVLGRRNGEGRDRDSCCNRLNEGGSRSLGEVLGFPTRDFSEDFCLDVFKVVNKEGRAEVFCFGRNFGEVED